MLYTSMLALASMASGLILWWPGVRRFVNGFVVRTRRGFYAFNFDLHQTMGAIVLPLLALITLTGVLLPYGARTDRLARLVSGESAAPESEPARLDGRLDGAEGLPVVASGLAALAAVPDGKPAVLRDPEDPAAPVEVLFQIGRWGAPSIVTVLVDPGDATILQVRDPRSLAPARRFVRLGVPSLHYGDIGGPVVRVLYVIVCLVGAVLPISGALIWWLRRGKAEAVAERQHVEAQV